MLPDGRELARGPRREQLPLVGGSARATSGSAPRRACASSSSAGPGGEETRLDATSTRTSSPDVEPPDEAGRARCSRWPPLAAGCSLGGGSSTESYVDRRLRPRRPRGAVGRARLGRGAARRDPARRPGADGARPQPLPRLGRHVGRLGRLRPDGGRLLRRTRSTRPTTCRPPARRRSATPPTASSCTATRSPPASRRPSTSSPRRWSRSATGSTSRAPRATRRRRSATASPPP